MDKASTRLSLPAVPTVLTAADPRWPGCLNERLGARTPTQLWALGNVALLGLPKTALFSSARCPGPAILAGYDQASHWRAQNRCVIGGFHAPMEKECLRILLNGPSPIIICPARDLPRRLPPEWHRALATARLLVLTCFAPGERRATIELAVRRNEIVAALAEEHYFAHIAPGSQTEKLAQCISGWRGRPTLLACSSQ